MNSKTFRNQPIDLTRGQGWNEATWAIHEKTVERTAKKADMGLDYLGITYDKPKVGLIHNASIPRGEVHTLGGLSLNEVIFFIYTEQTENNKPRVVHNAALWSSLTVHEVTHGARSERYPDRYDMVELAATEGLAYTAQRAYIAKFCAKQIVPLILDYELEQPDPMFKDYLKAIASKDVTYPDALEWSTANTIGHEVNNASIIGAQLVQQQINKGFTFADLMNQPAGDILGL